MSIILRTIQLLVLIPFLALTGYGLYMTVLSAEISQVAEGEAEPGVAMKILGKVLTLMADRAETRHVAALTDDVRLSKDRAVTIRSDVDLAELLAAGEAMPAPAFRDLYAEARAGAFLQAQECGAILATIGTACVVVGSEARRLDNGRYQLTAQLAFAPADPIGTLPAGKALDYQGGRIRLLDGTVSGVTRDQARALRDDAYREAASACAAVRAASGACVIETVAVEITSDPDQPDSHSVTASAKLATFRPES